MERIKATPKASNHKANDIAIIGMAGFFPKATDLKTFWQNITGSVNCIEEIPSDRWDWRLYYDPDRKMKDKVYAKWGAFLPDVLFDPLTFGIPPKALSHIETTQLLMLESTRQALADSGYEDRPFNRKRTSVYIGTGASEADLGQHYTFRSMLPHFFGDSASEILSELDSFVPEWSEDSFPGILINIVAGRIANRFDLGGANCTLDAACASSLAALRAGILDLKAGESDMVIVGGADTLMSPFVFKCFSSVGALSPTGKSVPFDQAADGIVLGETVAAIILKRLEDAKQDGDKIYAVIKGMSASSDGKAKGLTAPRPEGQILALERAYENSDIDPATVDLIEAHGTGTVLGDQTEAKALRQFFGVDGRKEKTCAIGSVKSIVGHAKCAAGIAGIIKVAMALNQKVLPPTRGIEKPLTVLDGPGNPLYLNTETRPWIADKNHPRRAGLNSFGFGGTNFHTVLEEYVDETASAEPEKMMMQNWETELFVFRGSERSDVAKNIHPLYTAIKNGSDAPLKDLAFSNMTDNTGHGETCLAIVASSIEDLKEKLETALSVLKDSGDKEIWKSSGIYYCETVPRGKIAFVFPGQGSQYTGMLTDLSIHFNRTRQLFERFDHYLADVIPKPLSAHIFPPKALSSEDRRADEAALTATNIAQPAMGNANLAILNLLEDFGLKPDMTAGHSYGEYVALYAAGVMDEKALAKISETRGRLILEAAGPEPGTMAAVKASEKDVDAMIADLQDVWIANLNSPEQTVISGTRSGIKKAVQKISKNGFSARAIPVACAFHSPIVSSAGDNLKSTFSRFDFRSPKLPVYSNTTAEKFPEKTDDIQKLLARQLASPVRFVDQINAMYADGARIFVEVGAGNVLSNLIDRILDKKPHKTIYSDKKGNSGLTRLQHALAQLSALGIGLDLTNLYINRECKKLDLINLTAGGHLPQPSKTACFIGNAGVTPLTQKSRTPVMPRPICFQDKITQKNTQGIEIPDLNIVKDTQFQSQNLIDYRGDTMSNSNEWTTKPSSSTQQTTVNDTVINKFQDLMSQFLDTQKSVMLAYLNGSSHASLFSEQDLNADIHNTQDLNHVFSELQEFPGPDKTLETGPSNYNMGVAPHTQSAEEYKPPEPGADSGDTAAVSESTAASNQECAFDIQAILIKIVSDRTGYPEDMLEMDLEIQADLGIDSIKRVQVLEELEAELKSFHVQIPDESIQNLAESFTLGEIVERLKAVVGTPTPSAETDDVKPSDEPSESIDIKTVLINTVSDLCGYPADTLELDLEIEADLGIDSIKRIQIMEHMEANLEESGIVLQDDLKETLAASTTLDEIIQTLSTVTAESSPAVSASKPTNAATGTGTAGDTEADIKDAEHQEGLSSFSFAEKENSDAQKEITTRLYKLIEKETGYPQEVLEPDLSLLNDLEIDARKKDEILDNFLASLEDTHGNKLTPNQQQIHKIHLLKDIVDWVTDAMKGISAEPSQDTPPPLGRFVLIAKECPLIYNPGSYFNRYPVLVIHTGDNAPADGVIKHLQSAGYQPLTLEHGRHFETISDIHVTADLTDFDQLKKSVTSLKAKHGRIGGVIHLVPLSEKKAFNDMTLTEWHSRLSLETKSLFYITKILADDLAEAAQNGEASIVAATAMGGCFASVDSNENPLNFFPGNGGVSGYVKTLACEFPGINARVVDLDPFDKPQHHIQQITSEFLTPSADIEVGYRSSRRLILDISEARLDTEGKKKPETMRIDSSWNFLITGGGRGITSTIALELAERFQPTILLVGRTPLDKNAEDPETAAITDEKTLKTFLANRLKSRQSVVKPMDIEKEYTHLIRQREIRQSLGKLWQTGAKAYYFDADVKDEAQMKCLVDTLYDEFGKIDGVIHGAGVIEDKMIRDKDTQSFHRVFDTKSDSIFILSRILHTDSLKLLALFSSVAGRFGNAGQSDYSAANEVYNKSALYLNRHWPGRVVSFIWGPWESSGGMVTEEVRKKFAASGIYMIPRDIGARAFVDEIINGSKNNVEVIYGSWDGQKKNLMTTRRTERLPLFCFNSNFNPPLDGTVELVRRLDLSRDIYLLDHKLDGNPVLPMAMAMEMMVEAVIVRYPDFHIRSVENLKVLKGVILKKDQEHIRIVVKPIKKSDTHVILNVQIRDIESGKNVYYEATVELFKEANAQQRHTPITLQESGPFPIPISEAYDKQLFHGPIWQGIESIETIGKNGIIGRLRPSRPETFIQGASSAQDWIIDPLVVDSGLQLILLWMRKQYDMTPLPSQIRKYVRIESGQADESLRCEIQVNQGGKGIKEADLFFIKPNGRLFGKIEGLEIIGSKALNRLSEKK